MEIYAKKLIGEYLMKIIEKYPDKSLVFGRLLVTQILQWK